MLKYTLRRLAYMAVTLLAVSIVTFIVIQLPPGDFLTQKIAMLQATGQAVSVNGGNRRFLNVRNPAETHGAGFIRTLPEHQPPG